MESILSTSFFLKKKKKKKKDAHRIGRNSWRTTFFIISFPAMDKNFAFQLLIQLQLLSTKCSKHLALFSPKIVGKPRYFSNELMDLIPEIRVRFYLIFEGVFFAKKKKRCFLFV